MGETFAFMQIKTIWSVLIRKYEFELVGDLPEPDYEGMVVGPKHPCTIRYKKRHEEKRIDEKPIHAEQNQKQQLKQQQHNNNNNNVSK